MANLADMTVTLGMDDCDFTNKIKNAEKNVQKFGDTTKKEVEYSSELFGKLAAAVASVGVLSFVAETAKLNTEIVNTAKALNISTEAAIAFQKATAAAGGDADNARDALISLSQKLGEAKSQGGDALAAFNEMGLGLRDIINNSPEQMLLKTLKAMNQLSDSTQRESIRTRLFGEDFKNADIPSVIRNMESLAGKAKELAPAYEAARQSQLAFNQSFADFQDQLTIAIPWDSMSSSLKAISDNMDLIAGSIKGILEIGAAFLFVSKIMVPLRNATAELAGGFKMMGGVLSWLKTHVIVGTFGPLLESLKDIFAVFVGAGPFLTRVGTSLAGIFGFGSKAAVLYVIADGFNEIIKSITGIDVIGKLDELTQSVARFFGIAYQTEYHKKVRDTALKQASDEAIEAENKRTEATARTSKLLQDQQKALAQIHAQYKQTNEQALAKLELDNSLIGATEQQKRQSQVMMDLDNQRKQVVQGLYDKIFEATDPELIKNYSNAIQQVNKDFAEQSNLVSGLIEQEQEKLQIQKLNQYATQSLFDVNTRIADAENERAKVFLPLIEKKYQDIEYAAKKSYEAQLQALASESYGGDVSKIPKQIADEYKALSEQKIQAEKDAAKAVEDTTNAFGKQQFATQSILDLQKQLRDTQNEIAYSTMPAYEAISAKITNDAKEKAIAEIAAENARRGSKMSADEERAYYDAALSGTDALIKKQQESYIISRKWSTGWQKALNNYIQNATDAAKTAENLFSKAMSGMEDMFVGFVKTGKFQWKDFVNSMLEELLRAQFQSVFAKLFSNVSGTGQQNTGGSVLGNLFSGLFAEGGTIPGGKWGIVGEAGPEIVNGPASVTPMKKLQASSNMTNVTYNINAVDSRSFKQMIAADPTFIHAIATQGAKAIPGRR